MIQRSELVEIYAIFITPILRASFWDLTLLDAIVLPKGIEMRMNFIRHQLDTIERNGKL